MSETPRRLRSISPKEEIDVPSEIMSTATPAIGRGKACPNSACTMIVTTGVKPFNISMKETVR